jgi:hypothetical protein
MTDKNNSFFLIQDQKTPWWFDVMYLGEEKPRYMINIAKNSCTCKGNTMGDICKHLKELYIFASRKAYGNVS